MKTFRKIFWFIKEEKKSYMLGILALAGISFFSLFPPRIIGYVVDLISEDTLTTHKLLFAVVTLVMLAFVIYAMRYLWRVCIFGSSFRLERKMRLHLFDHFTKMPTAFYKEHRIGDLMAHATNDIKAIQRLAGQGVLQFVDAILTSVMVLLAMIFTINWKLTLISMLPMPFMIIGAQYLGKRIHSSFNKAQESFSNMNNRVHENITGVKVTKAFGQEKQEINRFKKESEVVYRDYMEVAKWDARFTPLVIAITTACYALIFIVGIQLIQSQEITAGMLSAFVTYMHSLIWPMMAFGFLFNTLERGAVSYERIEKILGIQPINDARDQTIQNHPQGDLSFSIDSFFYPDEPTRIVLKDIHIDLKQGQTLGIIGRTGSGKSSLIKILLREYESYEGIIYFGNHELRSYSLNAVRKSIGYVPQDQFLFSMSVMENICFGRPNASLDDVMNAAKIAGVHEDIMRFEHQYDTLIGERGVSLSGGQRQRLAIARAMILDPELLILDDALSAVDAKTEEYILTQLRHYRQQKTTIITAHRLSALKHADVIVVLQNGCISEKGTHDELIQAHGWYAQIYAQQKLSKEQTNNEGL